MPVSYLTNSVAEMFASALNTLTEGSFSHLTMSEDEMLARVVTEMTGQEYSHLTTSRETLWELLLTQAAADEIVFDRLTHSNEQIAEIIANNVSAGGGEEYEGPLDIVAGAVVAYSQRGLTAAWTDPVIRLLKDGTASESDFSPTLNHAVDAAAVATFLGGASGLGMVLYDQSGNGDDALQALDPPWIADAGNGNPAFTCEAGRFSTDESVTCSGGARTYALVFGYTQNENGNIFCRHRLGTGGPDSNVAFGAFWNAPNDLYVTVTDGESQDVTWVAPMELATGRHLFEVKFAANGDLTLLVDGADAGAVVDSGAAFALPASVDGLVDLPQGAQTTAVTFLEAIVWPQSTSAAQANIADYYGITL